MFRAIRELLTNVLKHARTPAAKVALRREGDHLEIAVEDQGVGFDPSALHVGQRGFGLFSVREQVHRLGGTMAVDSADQRGTRIRLNLPLEPAARAATEAAHETAGENPRVVEAT